MMLLDMMLDIINKLGVGHGAWVTLFIVPAAHSGNDYRVADHCRRHQAKSPRIQDSRRVSTRRQDADQRNDTGEQRKLQAEEDHVVLLCRD